MFTEYAEHCLCCFCSCTRIYYTRYYISVKSRCPLPQVATDPLRDVTNLFTAAEKKRLTMPKARAAGVDKDKAELAALLLRSASGRESL